MLLPKMAKDTVTVTLELSLSLAGCRPSGRRFFGHHSTVLDKGTSVEMSILFSECRGDHRECQPLGNLNVDCPYERPWRRGSSTHPARVAWI